MDSMSKIILVIIAFQVVMGILAKRKARRKAEEADGSAAEADPRVEGRRPGGLEEVGMDSSRRPESGSRRDRIETEGRDDWGDHHASDDGEHESSPRPGARPGEKPGQGAQLGKDLLSQLAKELGLDLPESPRPKPAPRPSPAPSPVSAPKPVPAAKPAPARPQPAREHEPKSRMPSAARSERRPSGPEWDPASPRRTTRSAPVTEAPAVASAGAVARESMLDLETLRRAIILKTILDKPLSLQPRQPGFAGPD